MNTSTTSTNHDPVIFHPAVLNSRLPSHQAHVFEGELSKIATIGKDLLLPGAALVAYELLKQRKLDNDIHVLIVTCAQTMTVIYILSKLQPIVVHPSQMPTKLQQVQYIAIDTFRCAVIINRLLCQDLSMPMLAAVSIAIAAYKEFHISARGIKSSMKLIGFDLGASIAVVKSGVCLPPSNIPSSLLRHISAFSDLNIELRHQVLSFLGIQTDTLAEALIVGPVLEEVVLRGVVQEWFLRRLPRVIMQQVTPRHAWVIDSVPCKVMRIFTASTLFALMHTASLPCYRGGVLPQFVGGIIFGYSTETHDGSLAENINSHIIYNSCAFGIPMVLKNLGY